MSTKQLKQSDTNISDIVIVASPSMQVRGEPKSRNKTSQINNIVLEPEYSPHARNPASSVDRLLVRRQVDRSIAQEGLKMNEEGRVVILLSRRPRRLVLWNEIDPTPTTGTSIEEMVSRTDGENSNEVDADEASVSALLSVARTPKFLCRERHHDVIKLHAPQEKIPQEKLSP